LYSDPRRTVSLLREIEKTKQIPGESRRRWFVSTRFELIVWVTPENRLKKFQLCYRESGDERALTWSPETGFTHETVESGEEVSARPKGTPVLVQDGQFERDRILAEFERESAGIDPELSTFVKNALADYPISLGEHLCARLLDPNTASLRVGPVPGKRLATLDQVWEYTEERISELPEQALGFLGAYCLILCLGQARWAPPEIVLDTAVQELSGRPPPGAEKVQKAFQRGVELAREHLEPLVGKRGSGIFLEGLRYVRQLLATELE
jgi:hypothetical protein